MGEPSSRKQRKPSNPRSGKVRGLWLHKNGYWYFSRMRLGKRVTVALGTRDEKSAIKQVLGIVESPELAWSLGWEAEIERYIADRVKRNCFSRFTASHRKVVLGNLARWMRNRGVGSIQEVTSAYVQSYCYELRRTLKPATINAYLSSGWKPFFRHLVEERKIIPANPVEGVDTGFSILSFSTRERFCEPPLRNALLHGWTSIPHELMDRDHAQWIGFILHAGFEAGLTKNEIIEARPTWFDLENRTLRVQKTDTFQPRPGAVRTIPLSDVFLGFLTDHPLSGTWCIAPEKTRGRGEYRWNFEVPLRKYIKWRAKTLHQKLGWVTPRVMRHTFGSLLAARGVSLSKIAKWLGDSEEATARRYAYLQDDDSDIDRLR